MPNNNFDPTGAMSAASGAGQAVAQQQQDRSNYTYNSQMDYAQAMDMYKRTRADSVSDWNKNNTYNSPEQQMVRLKAAGLNPNLVYGNGTVGNSSSTMSNPTPSRHGASLQSSKMPDLMGNAAQIIQTMAQTDNLKAVADANRTNAEIKKLDFKGQKEDFGWNRAITRSKMEASQEGVDVLKTNRQFTLNEDQRQADELKAKLIQYSATTDLSRKQIDRIEQDIKNGKLDATLKAYEVKLNDRNIQRNDPVYYRIIMKWLGDSYDWLAD